ncbi:hypothetical protein NQ317_006876 [Molorchus minor]|uniref:MADF domain-containing protein n=1 Tax=Molorchus minor TaxID=1323400 RepID=A0ABQ9JU21_9CUCU|nr:hypothetical protein NQ317_006876 [Molorchus minor]
MADRSLNVINSSKLIEEIRKHRALYDLKVSNGNVELKKQNWEDVAKALFEDRWMHFNSAEKDALVREIQVKWKSLRDNFTRILRKEKEDEQSGQSTGKKKRYIYYDQLMFLLPHTSFRKNISNVIYVDENKDSNESFQSNEENPLQTSTPSSIGSVQPLQFIQIQPSPSLPSVTTLSTNQSTEEDDSNSNKRIASVLEQVIAIQKEEKNDDPMGNKKFLFVNFYYRL